MNSEGVCWVSARKDLLSNALFLATLLAWESYRTSEDRKRYVSAVALFALALLAKVSVVLLPAILLLMDWREQRTINRKTFREVVPFAFLSAIFIVIALFGKTSNIASLTPMKTLLLSAKSIIFYPITYLFPFSLSSIYHQNTPITFARMEFIIPILLIALITLLSLYALRRSRAPLFSLLFFLMMLAPSFANFSKMGGLYFASDRYIGIAQIGLLYAVAVGWSALQASHWRRATTVLTTIFGLIILPAFAFASFQRSVLWGDSETLFRDAMEKNPGSAVIHFNLAVVEQERGKYHEALALYEKAIAIRPDYSPPLNNAGVIYRDLGNRAKAEEFIRKAVDLDPHNLAAVINLASVLLDRSDADEAITLLERALAEDPYNVPALTKLGAAYGKKEMYKEGLHAFQKAWKLDPVMHEQSKELEKMLEELEKQ
jgi:tetratricopeptide (TPR) repeat protein